MWQLQFRPRTAAATLTVLEVLGATLTVLKVLGATIRVFRAPAIITALGTNMRRQNERVRGEARLLPSVLLLFKWCGHCFRLQMQTAAAIAPTVEAIVLVTRGVSVTLFTKLLVIVLIHHVSSIPQLVFLAEL